MNRAQLREATYDKLGVDSTDPRLGTARIDRLINEALHWIETDKDWPWLMTSTTFSTAAGTGAYTAPTDWLRTRSLRIADYSPLEVRSSEELDYDYPLSTEQGVPTAFGFEGDQLLLRPLPSGVYTVTHRYVRMEPDLNNDDQSPLMPASFHPAIAEVAAYLSLRRTREEERAAVAFAAYKDWHERMVDNRRRTQGTPSVRIRPGGWI
jgi:hypothetical protein